MIYFIRDELAGTFKIGKADDPARRLAGLQCGNSNPLSLVGTIPGGMAEEQRLHVRFGSYRTRGEWFRWDDESAAAVAELLDRYGDDGRGTDVPPHLFDATACRQFQSDEAANLEIRQVVRTFLFASTSIPCDLYWGSEPFMTGAKRPCSFQVMPDPAFERHRFWGWHVDRNSQWHATPGHAADAWVKAYRFWSRHVAPWPLVCS